MNLVTYLYPCPWCPIPLTNRARAYIKSDDTNIRRTFAEHQTGDDYDMNERTAHLDMMGEFQP